VSLENYFEDDRYIRDVLFPVFGDINPDQWKSLRSLIEWVHLEGGQQIIQKGDPSDCIYFLLQGRLTVLYKEESGRIVKLGEVHKGQSVGELGFFVDKPRSADVYANRDSTLIKFDKNAMDLTTKLFPELMIRVMNTVIRRASDQLSNETNVIDESRNIAVLYEQESEYIQQFVEVFANCFSSIGKCKIVDKSVVDYKSDETVGGPFNDTKAREFRQQKQLEELELDNDFLLLCASGADDVWLERAIRQADVICILKSRDDVSTLNHAETIIFSQHKFNQIKEKHLIILHSDGNKRPQGTPEILRNRPVNLHHHVRLDRTGDIERVFRFLTNRAIGIAFAGGGAKGLAHLGTILSFRKNNVPIDYFAGTSVGAIGSAIGAMDLSEADTMEIGRMLAKDAPTRRRNMNFFPFISMMKGRDLDDYTERYFGAFMIEDLWINFGCVASNLTTKSKVEITSGKLNHAIRSSIALPGVFTPFVAKNELWIDGGVIDNLPIGLLVKNQVAKKIIVTLDATRDYQLGYEQVPDSWEYILQKIKGIKLPIPKLSTIIMEATVLASYSKYHEAIKIADLHLKPPVSKIGLLQWKKFKQVVEIGRSYSDEMLTNQVKDNLLFKTN